MRQIVTVLTVLVVTGGSAAGQSAAPQPRPKCPTARMTLLGALVGFGAGVAIGSPLGSPLGGNVFEDTADGGQKMWFAVGGLTLAGAVVGHVLAQRCVAGPPSPSRPAGIVLSEGEIARLARTIRMSARGAAAGDAPRRMQACGLRFGGPHQNNRDRALNHLATRSRDTSIPAAPTSGGEFRSVEP
jgi:hypothetical protein